MVCSTYDNLSTTATQNLEVPANAVGQVPANAPLDQDKAPVIPDVVNKGDAGKIESLKKKYKPQVSKMVFCVRELVIHFRFCPT